ncbi:MAG: CBS and ACT domain-containing protein [Thermodesulfobacteriota bacterium]
MLVKYWMKQKIATVKETDSLQRAIMLMRESQQLMLPVMNNGDLVGVITDRDVKRASASDATALEIHELAYLIARITVADVMTRDVITIPLDFTLEEAAAQLLINNISGAPVVDTTGKLVGIITQREIFIALLSLTGFGKKGIQIAVEVDDRPGSIKEVTDIVRNAGGRLVSLLTSYERVTPGHRRLYVRAWAIDRDRLPSVLEEIKQKATLLYYVDHRENKREEFVKTET